MGTTAKRSRVDDGGKGNDLSQFHDKNILTRINATTIVSLVVLLFAILVNGNWSALVNTWSLRYLPRDLRPINLPKLTFLSQFQGEHGRKYLWGTYRPGLYFGVRSRQPKSTLMGLMWVDPERGDALHAIRHEAQQSDGLQRWGWLAHDGRSFGRQNLVDRGANLTISWVKSDDEYEDWAVRINATPVLDMIENEEEDRPALTVFLYFGDEEGGEIQVNPSGAAQNLRNGKSDSSCTFWSNARDGWCVYVAPSSGLLEKSAVHYSRSRVGSFHNITDLVKRWLYQSLHDQHISGAEYYSLILPNIEDSQDSNLAILQITLRLPFSLDLTFLKGEVIPHSPMLKSRQSRMSGDSLKRAFLQAEASFEKDFVSKFGRNPDAFGVAKAALSNLLGGIGYWYGHSMVKIENDQLKELWDAPLFSGTPSRSFFPRGFLWDEGFHQIIMRKWSPNLSRDILSHWLDLMSRNGWIAREQILGEEARSRVPSEFVAQSPSAANPPTFFLVLSDIAAKIDTRVPYDGLQEDLEFLKAAWPRLHAWYSWYNRTQAGPLPGSFRWRGRDSETDLELNPKTLTSGLDDYPRASHPSEIERHVDLRCWMALASRAMARISLAVNAPLKHQTLYEITATRLEDYGELKNLHWDKRNRIFADWGNDTIDVELISYDDNFGQQKWRRVVNGSIPCLKYVNHVGYVTFFPLALQLIPKDAPELEILLDLLASADHLWTEYGIRSLSSKSSIYRRQNTPHDPPYWRSAVWINMNYLLLRALQAYAAGNGPAATKSRYLAAQLRCNLIKNIAHQYNSKGFVFENYDDLTGEGKGCHPFTGWTALLGLISMDIGEQSDLNCSI